MSTETKDFAEFLRQKIVVRYLDEIAADSQKAIDIANRNLSYRGLKEYPRDVVSDYKGDLKCLSDSESAFNAELMRVDSGRAKNLDALAKTYHQYLLNLEILEIQNGDHSALVDADMALKVAALVVVANEISPLGIRYRQLNDKTASLIKQLQEANKACRDKALKAAIVVPLAVLATIICPEAVLARLAWRGGVAVTQTIVSMALSKGGGERELAGVMGTAGAGYQLYANLSAVEPGIMTSLKGSALAIATNAPAVGWELSKVKKLEAEIKAYMDMYKAVCKAFGQQTKGVMDLARKAEQAHKQAVRNVGRTSPNTSKRKKLIDEINRWDG